MCVLQGLGVGEFNYTDVAEAMQYIPEAFNLGNPPYRDGFYTLPIQGASTWMAIRYKVENPGVSVSILLDGPQVI